MDRPERVVDVGVGEFGEPARERGVVGLLARIEPQVLEQDDRGVGELAGRGIPQRHHGLAQEFGEPLPHRRQAQSVVDRTLGPAEMRTEHQARATLPELA